MHYQLWKDIVVMELNKVKRYVTLVFLRGFAWFSIFPFLYPSIICCSPHISNVIPVIQFFTIADSLFIIFLAKQLLPDIHCKYNS